MIELMLMRHAKSDWHNNASDHARPLNDRGCADALRMNKHLLQLNLIPDKVIASNSLRTQQTAEILLTGMKLVDTQINFDHSLYLANRQTLINTIKHYARKNQRLLILAHNPGIDDLVDYLCSKPPPLTKNGKLMVTSAIAVFQINSLENLDRAGQGQLINLFRPRDISTDI